MANNHRGVKQFSLDGVEIAVFDKMEDAAKQTGTNLGSIVNCCRSRIKSANGFIWKYENSKLKPKSDPMDSLLDFNEIKKIEE
jgi:hypothetical protein